jgi:hypothetical protein
MNNFAKNVLLLVIVLVLSYLTAGYFGLLYNVFVPYYENSFFSAPKESALLFNGFIFAYLFFFILVFQLLNKNNRLALLLLLPAMGFFIIDWAHIYLPIVLGLIAWILATMFRKIFRISN